MQKQTNTGAKAPLGEPEIFLNDETGIGIGIELRCPHCYSKLALVNGEQAWLNHSRLECQQGHVLVVSVVADVERSLLYLATTKETA